MMFVIVLLPQLFIIGLCMLLGRIFSPAYSWRWWISRLGIIPVLCFGAAAYISAHPTPISMDYDPNFHGNPGRGDLAAMLVWGLVFPIIYLLAAVPVSLAYIIWRRRKS
ncbi:hypothetical protein [Sphingobium sp. Leaf26]|uniref:hypothetical protein n=1 Tax=Sphingobium sp. Leaf26 TaxID=1735693 RepID=UPI0006F8B03D|nr:hypothetical protein [Sphingobium sp. Leaf26]